MLGETSSGLRLMQDLCYGPGCDLNQPCVMWNFYAILDEREIHVHKSTPFASNVMRALEARTTTRTVLISCAASAFRSFVIAAESGDQDDK